MLAASDFRPFQVMTRIPLTFLVRTVCLHKSRPSKTDSLGRDAASLAHDNQTRAIGLSVGQLTFVRICCCSFTCSSPAHVASGFPRSLPRGDPPAVGALSRASAPGSEPVAPPLLRGSPCLSSRPGGRLGVRRRQPVLAALCRHRPHVLCGAGWLVVVEETVRISRVCVCWRLFFCTAQRLAHLTAAERYCGRSNE